MRVRQLRYTFPLLLSVFFAASLYSPLADAKKERKRKKRVDVCKVLDIAPAKALLGEGLKRATEVRTDHELDHGRNVA